MKTSLFVTLTFLAAAMAHAKFNVRIAEPERAGEKILVKLNLKNTFREKVESARATLFLLDEHGKAIQQLTQWVVGGSKDRPPLAPGASTTYNFVITTEKPFTSTKLIFSRIVLEGGKLADPVKDFELDR